MLPYRATEESLKTVSMQYGGDRSKYDSQFILDDLFLHNFRMSEHYLNPDNNIVLNARDTLLQYVSSAVNNPLLIHESPFHMGDQISFYRTQLLNALDGNDKFGNKLVAVYQKVYGNLDESNPEQYKMYKKIYDDSSMVKLAMDFTRYSTGRLKDHPEFDDILGGLHSSNLIMNLTNYIGGSAIVSGGGSLVGGASTTGGAHTVFDASFYKGFINSMSMLYTACINVNSHSLNPYFNFVDDGIVASVPQNLFMNRDFVVLSSNADEELSNEQKIDAILRAT
jgi:hypothetical protein